MKTNVFIILLCLITLLSQAQSMPTKIYIVKNGGQTLGGIEFYTTLSPTQAIKVKNNGYVVVETDADSLGVFKEITHYDAEYQPSIKKQRPTFIKLESGKSYYFKIGNTAYSQHLDVEEMTERAFQLYIGLNELETNPKKYVFTSSKGLAKEAQ